MATRKRKQAGASRIRTTVANTSGQLLDTVHQVWLAGLGAMARAQRGTPKLFDELVKEGARVHANAARSTNKAVRSALSRAQLVVAAPVEKMRARATDTLENLEKVFQSRVQRALHQMGVPGSRDIEKLASRVETLNANVEKLARRRVTARGDGRRSSTSSTSTAH